MYKQYILVRTDKKYQRGKIIAHTSHNAVINFYEQISRPDSRCFLWFYKNDTTTVVLDGKSLKDIYSIINKAQNMNIHTSFVDDIHLKEKICAVVGPVTDDEAEKLGLKKLKLY